MKWFRMPSDMLADPVIQRLSPSLFKHWGNLLCVAGRGGKTGVLPDVGDIAFWLRIKRSKARKVLTQLEMVGLLDRTPEGLLAPHNWQQWQRDDGRLPLAEWRVIRAAVFARDDYTCRYCGARGVSLQADHIYPVSRGGSNDLDNLATACKPCNQSKRAKTLEEWHQKSGYAPVMDFSPHVVQKALSRQHDVEEALRPYHLDAAEVKGLRDRFDALRQVYTQAGNYGPASLQSLIQQVGEDKVYVS